MKPKPGTKVIVEMEDYRPEGSSEKGLIVYVGSADVLVKFDNCTHGHNGSVSQKASEAAKKFGSNGKDCWWVPISNIKIRGVAKCVI
jgi:hypothetical protein